MIIRASDYLPPVDVTFFEFLRSLITADFDLVPDDRLNYRVAFIDAFRRRGIYPKDGLTETTAAARTLSVETYAGARPTALDAPSTGTPSSGTTPSSPQDSNRTPISASTSTIGESGSQERPIGSKF